MAVNTLLRHPGVFKLGIANSPLTDWRLDDTIYTERYMGRGARGSAAAHPLGHGRERAANLNREGSGGPVF